MEDRLKSGIRKKEFNYPSDYETMSVDTALDYLELARDGHTKLFTPDNYSGFLALLVLKCNVDIDYAFGDSFEEDKAEIEKHITESAVNIKEVEKRINESRKETERTTAISRAQERYKELSAIKKMLQTISGTKPNSDYLSDKSIEEIDELYVSQSTRQR